MFFQNIYVIRKLSLHSARFAAAPHLDLIMNQANDSQEAYFGVILYYSFEMNGVYKFYMK